MSGQIVDATLVPAPKQRNNDAEKEAIKAGRSADEICLTTEQGAQKDTDARWTLKIGGKIRFDKAGKPLPQIALPVFATKPHRNRPSLRFIRECATTSASHADGRMLPRLVAPATRHRRSSPTVPTARGRTRNGWRRRCWSAASIAASRRESQCRRTSPGRTPPSPRSAPPSSMSSPIRRTASALHPNHWHRQGRGETDARQHRLQLRQADLPRASPRHGMSLSAIRKSEPCAAAGDHPGGPKPPSLAPHDAEPASNLKCEHLRGGYCGCPAWTIRHPARNGTSEGAASCHFHCR